MAFDIAISPPILGAPYRAHGRTPEGWDCWGCVAWLRAELFAKPTPSWAEIYGPADAKSPETVERLIKAGIEAWARCEPRAGAVVLLQWFGRSAHVGLMLGQRTFVHCMPGAETSLAAIDDLRWERRFVGCFDA